MDPRHYLSVGVSANAERIGAKLAPFLRLGVVLVYLPGYIGTMRAIDALREYQMQVVTYRSPRGYLRDICDGCRKAFEAGKCWPKDVNGDEYCDVAHGAHRGLCDICDRPLSTDVFDQAVVVAESDPALRALVALVQARGFHAAAAERVIVRTMAVRVWL